MRFVLIALGSVSLALGVIGVVVPGLPTTPFLLLSAACYVRSSNRLYSWLLGHRVFGPLITTYRRRRALPLKTKLTAALSAAGMVGLSVTFAIQGPAPRLVVLAIGLVGIIVVLSIPTLRDEAQDAKPASGEASPPKKSERPPSTT